MRTLLEEKGLPIRRSLETGLPLHRIREVHQFLSRIKEMETEIVSISEPAARLLQAPDDDANPWIDLLIDLVEAYRQETADVPLPLHLFVDWLYEALAEQRREKTIGEGLFLNTIHAVKGLEFKHVFILDGEWRFPPGRPRQEEERRLLYVGMTRAIETLCLLEFGQGGNPYLEPLMGEWMLKREAPATEPPRAGTVAQHRYAMLGLSDIHLGYADAFPADHPVHRQLSGLTVGDTLKMVPQKSAVALSTGKGYHVARLSHEGCHNWRDRIDAVMECRIIGMIYWFAEDGHPDFNRFAKVPFWQVPLVELVLAT